MPNRPVSFVYDQYGNTRRLLAHRRGVEVLANGFTNKGTSFGLAERRALGLEGLVPPAVRTMASQVANCRLRVEAKADPIDKFIEIRSLFDRNATLAHALVASDIEAFMPIIYTPTVGLACQRYSSLFRRAQGVHFFPGNIGQAEAILEQFGHREIRVAVVTDNQGILGIGDQGAGGIAICLGKLMLYTQGAGIAPWHCLPISLDVGTDNQALLDDPDYLGWRHPRLQGEEYVRFVQRFAQAFRAVFPNALCQWEDFSKQNAFAIRDAYLHDLISFNDDIQGTGAVTLAAMLSAMAIKKERLADQVFLIHGAGAGGVGIAEQIAVALEEEGATPNEARARIFTVDRRGLVTLDRPLEPYKVKFAKEPALFAPLLADRPASLAGIIRQTRATVLVGTSGQAGSFTAEVIAAMVANSPRPVILPLSNPTANCEATPEAIMAASNGRALVATGSPFPPLTGGGRSARVGQANNVFVFPGLGLGVLASGARAVLPAFFTAAARAVAAQVSAADRRQGILMPKVASLRTISLAVAHAVGQAAIREGVSGLCVFSQFQHNNDPERLRTLVERLRWRPEYLPVDPA
ncbi:MAG: NAD-dependent malic enzyme [Thermodesulfobacteriota bacterium]